MKIFDLFRGYVLNEILNKIDDAAHFIFFPKVYMNYVIKCAVIANQQQFCCLLLLP